MQLQKPKESPENIPTTFGTQRWRRFTASVPSFSSDHAKSHHTPRSGIYVWHCILVVTCVYLSVRTLTYWWQVHALRTARSWYFAAIHVPTVLKALVQEMRAHIRIVLGIIASHFLSRFRVWSDDQKTFKWCDWSSLCGAKGDRNAKVVGFERWEAKGGLYTDLKCGWQSCCLWHCYFGIWYWFCTESSNK